MPSNNLYRNWLRTLGAPEDPVATDTTSSWSLVSLMKALYQKITDGSFAAAVTGRAESLVSLCQGAAAQCAHLMRLCRTYKTSAASSAATSTANAALTAADAVTTAAQAVLSIDAAALAAGHALTGQRVRKDRVATAASATAAAAITPDTLVLGVQVYS